MKMRHLIRPWLTSLSWVIALLALFASRLNSATTKVGPDSATQAVNHLGLDLHRLFAGQDPRSNLLLSPYSIQTALAMTYGGADGVTRDEMARVLHFEGLEPDLHASFTALRTTLEDLVANSRAAVESDPRAGVTPADSIAIHVANRLFGQTGFPFRQPFLQLTASAYQAPFETLDFMRAPDPATRHINLWVEGQTQSRIRDLIPIGVIDPDTRLVLVNALHLKAPWAVPFQTNRTRPMPFRLTDAKPVPVPALHATHRMGYRRLEGFEALSLPYAGDQLQFVIFLPDTTNGLPRVETNLTTQLLQECSRLPQAEVDLALPRLRMSPPSLRLGEALRHLGMRTAFNIPAGSANFDRMTPRKPGDLLCISEVVHKTFLELDEKGTEAAAATAVVMTRVSSVPIQKEPPVVVRVDRPFAFAIQHRATGTCLFFGRITDPR
jgi:serpin B